MDLFEAITGLIIGGQGTKGEWEKEHRYKSFAPEREDCHVKWYVDAKNYFYAVSEALMSAKEEIFIEDLWLTPELVCSDCSVQRTIFFFEDCYMAQRSRDNSRDLYSLIKYSIFADLLQRTNNIVLTVFSKRKQKKE